MTQRSAPHARPIALAVALSCLITGAAGANDGFGGLTATGLTFGQTDAVAMVEEDLFIGLDAIRVEYLFRNITDADVTGEVIFPLPPIPLGYLLQSDWNLPADMDVPNPLDFTAVVDGRAIEVTVDRIAVIEPQGGDAPRPVAAAYDTPGRDVTADLRAFGIPLTLDATAVAAQLEAMDAATRDRIAAAGLAEFWPGEGENGPQVFAYPLWSVVLRHHWTQTFPAGAEVRVSHGYQNRPPGGLFGWTHPPQDYMTEIASDYCIDEGTSRGILRALAPEGGVTADAPALGVAYMTDYVLRTANSWAGPIGRFRLTLDKGDPGNIISLCAEGVRKTGPTTFVVEKSDYSPTDDLRILVVTPMGK